MKIFWQNQIIFLIFYISRLHYFLPDILSQKVMFEYPVIALIAN